MPRDSDRRSWDASTFERLYAADPDPWQFATSAYERAKYAATLAALPSGRRYQQGLEVGCSIGVFTAQLALRCERLLALDLAANALTIAQRACKDLGHVRFERRAVPADWPDGCFDLIVLAEMLYFLDPPDIAETARRTKASLVAGGIVLLVNWTGPTNTPTTGNAAAEMFQAALRLPVTTATIGDGYRIDVLAMDQGDPSA